MLYNYRTTKAEIKNIAIEIEELKNDYIGCSSISYEEKSAPTNQFNSSVENEVQNKEHQIQKLERLKHSKELQIEKIDNALEGLNDNRLKEIVIMKYFDKLQNGKIAHKFDLTEEWICKLRSDAIEKISNMILITI
ncbi:MAG: RNA polymerase subunit sigma, partial [Solirubrobacterales bacterium]